MRSPSDDLTADQRRVLADIDEDGVHIVDLQESDDRPGCSYSVGMWHSFEQPEVIVYGLPPEVARALIDAVADEAAEGAEFAAGARHAGLLQAYSVRFLAVPKAKLRECLPVACWAHENDDFPALQIVWPDKQGRWPWDPDTRDGFREAQPVLGAPEPGT